MRSFVAGDFDYSEFVDKMATAMGPFDTIDFTRSGLALSQETEVSFYVDWLGGKFGETEHLIPRRSEWEYGKSDQPYGWVDQDEYRRKLGAAFSNLLESDI